MSTNEKFANMYPTLMSFSGRVAKETFTEQNIVYGVLKSLVSFSNSKYQWAFVVLKLPKIRPFAHELQ